MALSSVESRLLRRAIHREPEAFSEIYLEYQPFVLRHVSYLVQNREEAEDITSETFLRAWNAIDRFEERGFSIRAWLLKIAYNLRTDHFKRQSRSSVTQDLTDLEDQLPDLDPRISPESVAESSSRWQSMWKAIQSLPKPQRQVIVLRFLNDLSYEEVQAIIGKSAVATRVIQHRALRTLQRSLQSADFDLVSARVATAVSGDVAIPANKLRISPAED